MNTTTIAHAVGKGVLAGLAGTALMTISSTVEMRLRQRQASSAPARAAEKVLGITRFRTDEAEQRFGALVHWAYGTGWGVFRGLIATTGMSTAAATAGHGAVMWGSEQVLLPGLGVAPPLTKWGATEVGIDAWHHLVHVGGTLLAYELLDRKSR